MRTQPETRARSAQEAGKRALNLGASKANQACTLYLNIVTPRGLGDLTLQAFARSSHLSTTNHVQATLPADEPRAGDAAGPQLRSGHLL